MLLHRNVWGVSVCSLRWTTKCQSIVMFNTDQNMTCSPQKNVLLIKINNHYYNIKSNNKQ